MASSVAGTISSALAACRYASLDATSWALPTRFRPPERLRYTANGKSSARADEEGFAERLPQRPGLAKTCRRALRFPRGALEFLSPPTTVARGMAKLHYIN